MHVSSEELTASSSYRPSPNPPSSRNQPWSSHAPCPCPWPGRPPAPLRRYPSQHHSWASRQQHTARRQRGPGASSRSPWEGAVWWVPSCTRERRAVLRARGNLPPKRALSSVQLRAPQHVRLSRGCRRGPAAIAIAGYNSTTLAAPIFYRKPRIVVPPLANRRRRHDGRARPILAMPAPALLPPPADSSRTIVRGACPHDCPDTCAMLVTVEQGRAVRVQGDPEHPFTQGFLCAKVNRYLERTYHPDRLRHPMRRVGRKGEGKFEPVSWDEALDEIADRLSTIADQHGPEAILPYSYAGTMGYLQGQSMDRRFFHTL